MKMFKAFVVLTFSLLSNSLLFAQGMTPEQQAKVDSLMSWVKQQHLQGKPVDQKKLDSANAAIRAMAPSQAKKDSIIARTGITEITKQAMAGGAFTVPEGKQWVVKRCYVNNGGSYNILTSVKFSNPYKAGEKVQIPSYSAEAELLNGDKTGFFYILKIEESNLPK